MSAILGSYRDELDACYAADFGRDREPMKNRSRHPDYRRKGGAPTRVGGMHCRRAKRWTWGSGRGARLENLRAFASCVVVALAGLASQAFGAPMEFMTVANPGNLAQPSGPNTGVGSVANTFYMSSTETTVAEYTNFLNQAAQSDPNGLWDSQMTAIGISRTGSPGSYAYSASSTFSQRPVTYVSWFDAARYVNWIVSGSTTTETGAYNVTAPGAAAFARQPGATYFLPSQDEWYKAAFYRPSSPSSTAATYGTWASTVGSGTVQPASAPPSSAPPAANWGRTRTVDVGKYSSTVSAYGLYDMLGNVTEWTDSPANSTQVRVFSGAFSISNVANWNADGGVALRTVTTFNDNIGFRVASTVAPVPEPGTIALALSGIAGVGGAGWLKRRRKNAA